MKTSALLFALMFIASVAPVRTPISLGAAAVQADQSFNVTNSGNSAYTIGGSDNPPLTLERNETVTFNINAPGHPFYIKTLPTTGTSNAYNDGVTGQGTMVGTVTFVVPETAPNDLFYQCSVHSPMGGTLNIIDPVGVPGVVPDALWLAPPSPNPVRQAARFRFALPREAAVKLIVLDLRGRVVHELLDARMPAGSHSLLWDGRNARGSAVPSGLYFYRLLAEGQSLGGKLVMLH